MPVIYFYLAVVLIGLFFFLKMQWALFHGHFSNLYALRKRGEAQQLITLEGSAYAWGLLWVLVFIAVLAYCAVMLLVSIHLARIDIFVILAIFFMYYIRQAITYMTAEFVKQRMAAKT